MKKITVFILGVLMLSCNRAEQKKTVTNMDNQVLEQSAENLDWLLGKWKRLNEEAGKETFENWIKTSDTEYNGLGYTLHGGDTISQEKMHLTKADDKWNLAVKLNHELESTLFTGVYHLANEFCCENNEIDFPNEIKYWKEGDKICATVSNLEMKLSFEFEKLQE